MAVSPETPTALAGLPCQRGVTPLDSPLPTRPACRQWGLRPPSERLFAVPAPIRLAVPSSALPRRASAPPLLRPVRLTIAKAYQVLLFFYSPDGTTCPIASRSIPTRNWIPSNQLNGRLGTQRNASAASTSYTAFSPHRISHSAKISSYQTRTVNFIDTTSRNLFAEKTVDFDSRFPQGIILCNGAVLYILMQMVSGKKAL